MHRKETEASCCLRVKVRVNGKMVKNIKKSHLADEGAAADLGQHQPL